MTTGESTQHVTLAMLTFGIIIFVSRGWLSDFKGWVQDRVSPSVDYRQTDRSGNPIAPDQSSGQSFTPGGLGGTPATPNNPFGLGIRDPFATQGIGQ